MAFLVRTVLCSMMIIAYASTAFASGLYFMQGDKGAEISLLQTKLKERGYYSGAIDGFFSYKFKLAVKEFQRRQHLPDDGIVDQETYREITGRERNSRSFSYQTKGIVETAQRYIGTPYVFGGTSPKGFDCSGFTQYVFKQQGRQLPRMADQQFLVGKMISRNSLQKGDLVFFSTYEKGASHEGIYMGEGRFIHASSSKGVMNSHLDEPYWKTHYLGARRVI